jgi:hypothetical protein
VETVVAVVLLFLETVKSLVACDAAPESRGEWWWW